MEMLLLKEPLHSFHIVGHIRVNGAGRAKSVRILLQQFGMINILETIHAAVHENSTLHVVSVHDLKGSFCRKVLFSVITCLRKKLELLSVGPCGHTAADCSKLSSSAISCQNFCKVEMRVYFLHSILSAISQNKFFTFFLSAISQSKPYAFFFLKKAKPLFFLD